MVSRRRLIASLALPAAVPSLHAAVGGRMRSIQSGLQPLIEANEIPGVVTLVTSRTSIKHFLSQGHADINKSVPMHKDAIFAIASMSKPITGAAVMMLQDEGKLSIDDPIAKYIPELSKLRLADGSPATITVKHLMTHTSGMGEATLQESEAAKTLADLIEPFASKPVAFPPGSAWKYCQSGINSLCRMVEVVSGMSFAEFLDRRLFTPLGMKSTTFYPTERQLPRIVRPCGREGDRLVYAPAPRFQDAYILRRDRPALGNGGLFSTAEDYSLFARMMLQSIPLRRLMRMGLYGLELV